METSCASWMAGCDAIDDMRSGMKHGFFYAPERRLVQTLGQAQGVTKRLGCLEQLVRVVGFNPGLIPRTLK